jgi:hypothetical protein
MAEGTTTVGECGVTLVRLGVALIIALVGFFIGVMGFVMDSTTMIVGGSGSTAVNGLAIAAYRWRRLRD